MKKFFALVLLVFLLVVGVFASLGWENYTKFEDSFSISQIVGDIQSGRYQAFAYRDLLNKYQNIPPELALILHEHLPGLFPATNVCWEIDPVENSQGEKLIFPGQMFPSNSNFVCANGERLNIGPDSIVYLTFGTDIANASHVFVVSGQVEFSFGQKSFDVTIRNSTMRISAQSDTNFVTAIRNKAEEEILQCLKGNITVAVVESAKWTNRSTDLRNQACQMEIADPSLGKKKSLPMGSRVFALDASKFIDGQNPDVFQPTELFKTGGTPTTTVTAPVTNGGTDKISIQMSPKKPKGDVLVFTYQLPVNQPMVCDLKTGSSANGPFANAYQFQAPNKAGTLDLQTGFNAFFLSLQCSDGRKTYTSNVLTPKK